MTNYIRKIQPADGTGEPIMVDVYSVLTAFGVTSPSLQHAIKKLLLPGQRGGGKDYLTDLREARAAIDRAIADEGGT